MISLIPIVVIGWLSTGVTGTEIVQLTGTKSFHELRGATVEVKGYFKLCKPIYCPRCIRILYVNAGADSTCIKEIWTHETPDCKAIQFSSEVKLPIKDGNYDIRMSFVYEYKCRPMKDAISGTVVGSVTVGNPIFWLEGQKRFTSKPGKTIHVRGCYKYCEQDIYCRTCYRQVYIQATKGKSWCVANMGTPSLTCQPQCFERDLVVPTIPGIHNILMFELLNYHCMKHDYEKGTSVGKVIVTDINECLERNPCSNGGTCVNTIGSYVCRCPAGLHGSKCENDKNECQDKPCSNGGACVNTFGSFKCSCPKAWTGDTCDKDVDECLKNPCQNGATCKNVAGGYKCDCQAGWKGQHCEQDVDECLKNPCQNGATCKNVAGGYNCDCQAGWKGQHCEQDMDECSKNPCQNGATCKNVAGGYNCDCQAGWKGQHCEGDVDECLKNPCTNGICNNKKGGYSCTCNSGWEGESCTEDINECLNNPCKNKGKCSNTLGGYSCSCKPGWQGKKCDEDTNECDKGLCKNGGDCENTIGSFRCLCTEGFYGPLCGIDLDECMNFPCLNGGTCINTLGSFHCKCPPENNGKYCEEASRI